MNVELDQLRSILQIYLETKVSLFSFDQLSTDLIGLFPATWISLLRPGFTMKDRINSIWSPAGERGEQISQILNRGCEDLLLLHAPKSAFEIRICYLFRLSSSFSCLVGNPPVEGETLANCTRVFPHFPESYESFTKIHNGLSVDGGSTGLLLLSEINLISQHLSYQSDLGEINPKFNSLLLFSGDGFGNMQCYDLEQPLNGDYVTVFWDHEAQDIYNPQSFWNYLEKFLQVTRGSF